MRCTPQTSLRKFEISMRPQKCYEACLQIVELIGSPPITPYSHRDKPTWLLYHSLFHRLRMKSYIPVGYVVAIGHFRLKVFSLRYFGLLVSSGVTTSHGLHSAIFRFQRALCMCICGLACASRGLSYGKLSCPVFTKTFVFIRINTSITLHDLSKPSASTYAGSWYHSSQSRLFQLLPLSITS